MNEQVTALPDTATTNLPAETNVTANAAYGQEDIQVFRDFARRYAEQHDPELWQLPTTLRQQFDRWKRQRSSPPSLEHLDQWPPH